MEIIIFSIIVGFIAQLIDGALGMAYGVTSNTALLSLGIVPSLASASVHTAEVFTTAASGVSHLKLGNVDKKLFKKLLIPGIIGGFLGAYVLTSIPGDIIKPFVNLYLLIIGFIIIYKAFKYEISNLKVKTKVVLLGGIGGFLDAIGGGGWGPIVTSTLVARGHNPRFTIGSVNLAEFFVTITEAITFLILLKISYWQIIIGLIIGGVLAAPLAASICKKLPPRILMIIVGITIIVLSIRNLYYTF
ncbi:MAG: sulfite exporter TauE/SafE family protein [Nitrososphaerota archaeon]